MLDQPHNSAARLLNTVSFSFPCLHTFKDYCYKPSSWAQRSTVSSSRFLKMHVGASCLVGTKLKWSTARHARTIGRAECSQPCLFGAATSHSLVDPSTPNMAQLPRSSTFAPAESPDVRMSLGDH